MANMNVNKVIYGGDVLIDLTGDSVSADKVSSGNPIKDSSGKTIQGQIIYRKARNSVLLDSTGDVIEDGFEQ